MAANIFLAPIKIVWRQKFVWRQKIAQKEILAPTEKNLAPKFEKKLLLSEYTNNNFSIDANYGQQKIKVEYIDFTENVEYSVTETETGTNFIKIVEASSGDRHDHYIEEGEVKNLHGLLFSFKSMFVLI